LRLKAFNQKKFSELKKYGRNILLLLIISIVYAFGGSPSESRTTIRNYNALTILPTLVDTVKIDTTGVLPYQFKDEPAFAYPDKKDSASLFLKNPSNLKTEILYDPNTGEYIFTEKVGDFNYRLPKSMTKKEFQQYDFEQSIQNYWRNQTQIKSIENKGGLIPRLTVGGEAFNKIFGSNTIDIRPQGYVEVSFGYQMNSTENPSIPERLRKVPTFDFDQKIQMNVTGKIGDRMEMRVNYNTEATFDYENKMFLGYTGDEDQIIKKIEAGNVSLPLNGSLITGGSNLFGIKTELQFGKLNLTTIFSQHKGETQVVESEGGAQKKTFDIPASEYDANRHFFLAQYFRDQYNEALQTLPIVRSSITVNKIEVWVTNKSSNFKEARNILAFMDMGEHEPNIYNNVPGFQESSNSYPKSIYPFNEANGLYNEMTTTYSGVRQSDNINKTLAPLAPGFVGGQDYEKIEQARLLSESEYDINPNLGFISLRSALNTDEVLAVAFNYTANGQTYQVGEFSTDGVNAPETLILKLLKGTNLSPKLPTWKLMMKNIYDLNAYQLSKEEFVLDIMYQNDETGTYINYLPESRIANHILLNVLNLDKLNSQGDLMRDGVFDYVEGITVSSSSGKIIFPTLEPFGKNLADSIGDPAMIEKYVYSTLYSDTRTVAEEDAEHNKFRLKGSYKGASSSEIMIGSQNLARGSVKVSAGGRQLQENVDYTVDYTSGIVKIINSGLLESGTPLQVSTESQDMFSMDRKTMTGAHANYAFSDRFNLGATVLHMTERPLTQKVNYGDDPISNTMLGLDANYTSESQLLTTLLDKLPFYATKEKSSISFDGEFAQLFPGHSKVINKTGTAYIDDYEATETAIDMKTRSAWALATTPQKQLMFPEADDPNNELAYGYNRAKLAWYVIDPLFLRNSPTTPDHIKNDKDQQSNHLVREVYENEIFPDKETPVGLPTNIPVLDLAFYPQEKGPYNFDSNPTSYSRGVNNDGTLKDPESRWGGIMRKIETSDFEAANIEFIEFWVMDPFVNDSLGLSKGGDLYFNLGDLSEDILKDSRKSFENGLPTTPELANVDTTVWGRVSKLQSMVREFDNNVQSRQYQDLGFDGLNTADERTFNATYLKSMEGILTPEAFSNVQNDPAGDNFHYYRGSDYDQQELSILERYKKYNGPDGNSPTSEMSPESYPTTATTQPDMEDINGDNTLNEYERYYQYRISIKRDSMVKGENSITDIKRAVVKLKNGTIDTVSWYQFRVPVRSPDETFGSINDFKSIRFLRMFMKGFSEPTVLRFATLDLVRADWRKYTKDIDGQPAGDGSHTLFDVSSVNIEENASRKPVNYVLPPGIERVIDPANPQLQQLNEQSLVLRTIDLEEGQAKAAYKSISMDFRNYKRLQLEVHAEEIKDKPLENNELSLFVRIGSDYNYNYYEYEIPLSLTPEGLYNGDNEADRYEVWPDANRMNLKLDAFTDLKLKRNDEMRQAGSGVSMATVYSIDEGIRKLKIKGNPNLGNVEVMMIGIRNRKEGAMNPARSVEVWVNELRLSDFEEGGGWAATGRVSARLADLGSVIFAGRTRTAGFGSIDQKINQRAMDDLTEMDLSANLELGKFFPEKAQVKIPVYLGFSQSKSNPKYNPLDPDIKMKDAIKAANGKQEQDSIKSIAQDLATRKSINFTNVKIDKTSKSGKPKIYDPTNFSVTYSYNEMMRRSINVEKNLDKNYRGLFSYNFSGRPEIIEPFKNSKALSKNAFRLIRDFNFYPLPSQFSFRTDMWRHYNETQLRNIANPNMIIQPTYNKDFLWNRYFDLRYNLTRSLDLDFSSSNTSRIDEPEGSMNRNQDDYELKRDSIMKNVLAMGRPIIYHHTINANYIVPVNKIPFLDWTSASARYQGMYDWLGGPITDPSVVLGNVIENSMQVQLNGQLNMVTLYNKVGYLKEINQKYGTSSRQQQRQQRPKQGQAAQPKQGAPANEKAQPRIKEVQYSTDNVKLKAKTPKSIFHKLNTQNVELTALAKDGTKIEGEMTVINENRISFTTDKSMSGVKFIVKGKVEVNGDLGKKILEYSARLLMSVRSISVNYSATDGTVLPGFMPQPHIFGSGKYTSASNPGNPTYAPGLPFLLGWQDKNFAMKAAQNGWLTSDSSLNAPFAMAHAETWNFRANVEPFPDLRIDLNANRTYSERMTEFYNYNNASGKFSANNKSSRGNFTMSINSMRTSFSKMGKEAKAPPSKAFEDLKANRIIVAQRLDAQRVENSQVGYTPGETDPVTGFPVGYGPTSPQVLIPAFIAAYTKQSPEKVALSPYPSMKYMRPNWRITYEGVVSKSELLKRYFKTLSFNHAYRSSYNVGSFISNLDYDEQMYDDGFSYVRNKLGDFIGPHDINTVSISEQFSPLINIDITWINDFETRAELKSSRNLALSFANNQLTEVLSNEMVFGLGYRFTRMDLIIKTKKSQQAYSNDLNVRADLSFRKNKTILRKIVEGVDDLTAGQDAITLKTTADYMLSDRFQLRLYFDRILNKPKVGSFNTSNTNFGVSFRFTLAQ
jgi:cell surface protein SprA